MIDAAELVDNEFTPVRVKINDNLAKIEYSHQERKNIFN